MADKPTTNDAFSGAATSTPKTVEFTDLERFRIQQSAKLTSCSGESAGRPFIVLQKH